MLVLNETAVRQLVCLRLWSSTCTPMVSKCLPVLPVGMGTIPVKVRGKRWSGKGRPRELRVPGLNHSRCPDARPIT